MKTTCVQDIGAQSRIHKHSQKGGPARAAKTCCNATEAATAQKTQERQGSCAVPASQALALALKVTPYRYAHFPWPGHRTLFPPKRAHQAQLPLKIGFVRQVAPVQRHLP